MHLYFESKGTILCTEEFLSTGVHYTKFSTISLRWQHVAGCLLMRFFGSSYDNVI